MASEALKTITFIDLGGIIIGTIFIIISILIYYFSKKKNKKCTIEVNATVVGYSESINHDMDHYSSYTYTPIYSFEYRSEIIETHTNSYSSDGKRKHRINAVEKIRFNPNDPYEITSDEDIKNLKIITIIFIIIGIAIDILSLTTLGIIKL